MNTLITWQQVQQNNPLEVCIALDAAQCADLAKDIHIIALNHYAAQLRFHAQNDGSLLVRGTLKAQAVQACAITDAPVTTDIDNAIAVRYVPPQKLQQLLKRDGSDNAILINSAEPEECEPLPPEGITPFALAREELILALPSYPRCPEAIQPDDLDTEEL